MVRFTDLDIDPIKKEYKGTIFADSRSEVTTVDALESMLNIPAGSQIGWGSKIITANADVGFIKSDRTINWPTD